VRAILVAGTGFFTDSYDIFCVSLLTIMLGIVYKHDNKGTLTTQQDTAIKLATSAGTVIGQFGFGTLADIVGRKKMYGLELILIIVATLAQSLVGPGPGTSVVGLIIFWRVLMGIGIGGDYPLSSIITSEFATTKWRGAMMGAVFAMQGFGQLGGALVMLCLVAGFKGSLSGATGYDTCTGNCQVAVDKMWRALIGVGIVPACLALYYRLTIPETPRYTFDVARDVEKAAADAKQYVSGKHGDGSPDEIAQVAGRQQSVAQLEVPKASFKDFFRFYGKLRNGKILFGTAMSWLLLDVAFYGLGLNSSTVLQAIGYAGGDNLYHKLYNIASGNAILVCAGAIPGYWLAVATIDTVGRKPLQLAGFAILTVLFIIWVSLFERHIFARPKLMLFPGFRLQAPQPPCHVGHLRPHPVVLQLGSQHHYLHRAWRMLPHPLPFYLPRYLCWFRKDWFHHRPGSHLPSSHPWQRHQDQPQPMAQPRDANIFGLHVRGYLLYTAHS
jgi:PHS family inorganic phosphate transporter-like MFS transporter